MQDMIFVTRPFLPPLDEVAPYLARIWQSRVLTNRGPLHEELVTSLKTLFDVQGLSLLTNGDAALLAALMSLDLKGSVVTTPFTFASTVHSIHLAGLTPIFADIGADDFNLSPAAVEAAIRPDTTAILAVHVYGTPCDVEGLAEVANRHGLKLIYDAAHAFGVRFNGKSIVQFGDMSALSFHATKSYNTFEGGAIASPKIELQDRINILTNFGIRGEDDIPFVGFNGKMSEFHAAIGLAQLKYIDHILLQREEISNWYREELSQIQEIKIPSLKAGVDHNYSYFPILFDSSHPPSVIEIQGSMKREGVMVRRYFSPLLSNLEIYSHLPSANKENLPTANNIAGRVICLPIYPGLSLEDRRRVVAALKKALQRPSATFGPL